MEQTRPSSVTPLSQEEKDRLFAKYGRLEPATAWCLVPKDCAELPKRERGRSCGGLCRDSGAGAADVHPKRARSQDEELEELSKALGSFEYHDMEQPWMKLPIEAATLLANAESEQAFAPIWEALVQWSVSPRQLLIALLEWEDAGKAGRFLAACSWPTAGSVAPWSRGRPPFWQSSQPTNQGELQDYLIALVCLRPPLDVEAMERAGKIIGTAWEPSDRNGRADALIREMIWLGSQASDGLSRLTAAHIGAFVNASGFLYDSDPEDNDDD
jgi:hypothetical protein